MLVALIVAGCVAAAVALTVWAMLRVASDADDEDELLARQEARIQAAARQGNGLAARTQRNGPDGEAARRYRDWRAAP